MGDPPSGGPTTVPGLVEAQVARTPRALAVVGVDGSLTYAEFDRRAGLVAARLHDLEVGPGIVVAVLAERSLEMAIGLLGILKAGGACLPLDPAAPAERVEFMLRDSGAGVVLATEHSRRELAGLVGPPVLVIHADEESGDAPPARPPLAGPDLAYVIYTSGSTGRPKGVMLPHRALINHHRAVIDLYGLAPGDRVVQFCSIGFDVSIEEMFPTWAAGGTVVLRDDAIPVLGRSWLEWLRHHRVTMLNLPTAYWHDWVRDLQMLGESVPNDIRLVTVGGEKALGGAYRTWLGVAGHPIRWINAYGPAEASIMATYFEPRPGDADRWLDPPIGRPIANTTVHVVDPSGAPVPAGAVGELQIGGAGLALGYLNQPGLTAERFIPDPFTNTPGTRLYRTGDLGRRLADGNLDFVGRQDHQVKIRGFRIELPEVEAAMLTHPGVAAAVVVAREDAPGVKRLVGYVVPGSGELGLTGPELRAFLVERLPRYMVPTAFIVLPALPTTANGKVDREQLPPPDLANRGLDATTGPATATEKALADIWARVLGLPSVGADEDFFDLGGHSLSATQVIAQTREVFAVELPLRAIFDAPTIRGLAAQLDADAAAPVEPPPLVAQHRAPGTPMPLSLAQEQMWDLEREASPPGLYNVTVQHRFSDPVDEAVLRQALAVLVERHEGLRTGFHRHRDRTIQSVVPAVAVELAVLDLRSVPPGDRLLELQRRIAATDAEPFTLEEPPLFRAALFRTGDRDAVVSVTFDHMISDGTSAYIFLSELNDTYSALVAGRTPDLPSLPLQYGDFAIWQRRWLTETRQQSQLEYWREKLRAMPLGPALAFDQVPATPSRRIASRPLAVAAPTYRSLTQVALQGRGTMFMVAAAAVEVALGVLGRTTDIVLSTTLSGRQRADLEGVIGFFAGIGRIRTDLSGDPPFTEILSRTRESILGLFDHQDLPFMRIRDVVAPGFSAGPAGAHPLARLPVEFQYFHAGQDGWAPGLGVVERAGPDKGPDELFFRGQLHPLSITLLDDGEQLWGEVNYKVDFYHPVTIERLSGAIEQMLQTVATSPGLRLSELADRARGDDEEVRAGATAHRPVGSWLLER